MGKGAGCKERPPLAFAAAPAVTLAAETTERASSGYDGWVAVDLSLAGAEPWTLTSEQFARHPDTLWHGSRIGEMGPGPIHIGTQKAAYQALRARMLGHGDYQTKPPGTYWDLGDPIPAEGFKNPWDDGYTDPARGLDAPLNPQLIAVQFAPHATVVEEVHPDLDWDGDDFGWQEMLDRSESGTVIRYKNDGEDGGSISYVTPDKSAFWTHEQFVADALACGLPVPDEVRSEHQQRQAATAPAVLTAAEVTELRAIRSQIREDSGTVFVDDDGAPMVGTGHCHDTCMEVDMPGLQMAGGWFEHPDGHHYEHSWLVHDSGAIVDPTADQWHLEDFDDVAVIAVDDPRAARYLQTEPILDEDGYWTDCAYTKPEDVTLIAAPADPRRRGTHR